MTATPEALSRGLAQRAKKGEKRGVAPSRQPAAQEQGRKREKKKKSEEEEPKPSKKGCSEYISPKEKKGGGKGLLSLFSLFFVSFLTLSKEEKEGFYIPPSSLLSHLSRFVGELIKQSREKKEKRGGRTVPYRCPSLLFSSFADRCVVAVARGAGEGRKKGEGKERKESLPETIFHSC